MFPKVVLLLPAVSTTTGGALHGDPAGDRDPPMDISATWRADASGEPVREWLAEFRQPALESLVTEAVAGNFELGTAASGVRARILIPMAVSLGFGILFATFVSLLLVPVAYLILKDLNRPWGRVAGTAPRHAQ